MSKQVSPKDAFEDNVLFPEGNVGIPEDIIQMSEALRQKREAKTCQRESGSEEAGKTRKSFLDRHFSGI